MTTWFDKHEDVHRRTSVFTKVQKMWVLASKWAIKLWWKDRL